MNEGPTPLNKDPTPRLGIEKRYEAICASIRATDEISFKLLGLIPLLTGAVIVAILKGEVSQQGLVWVISAFGAIVTFGIFRWELRNIQTCKWLMKEGGRIETEELGLTVGQFTGRDAAPTLLGFRMGKTEAEKIIYIASVIAWLTLPWVKVVENAIRKPENTKRTVAFSAERFLCLSSPTITFASPQKSKQGQTLVQTPAEFI